uniref:Putative iron-sulfur cluster-binding domain contining protein n=1 Tax=viral metagenome TaxID=1070528 RepID=A0A6M3IWH6_9ZZZZ
MPNDMILKVLNDVARWPEPLNEIIPVNYGEFFMRKDWLWVLQMIENKLPHTRIVIPTNGTKMDDKIVTDLCTIQTIDIINFSVNAFYDETYKAFMKLSPDRLHKIPETIGLIKVLRPDIQIRCSMVADTAWCTDYEKDIFQYFWKQQGVEPWVLPAASACRGTKLLHPVLIPCRSIFSDVVIGYDGKLASCCFDPGFSCYDLGEYSGDLKADWNNEKFTKFRELHNTHRRTEIPTCKGCSFA